MTCKYSYITPGERVALDMIDSTCHPCGTIYSALEVPTIYKGHATIVSHSDGSEFSGDLFVPEHEGPKHGCPGCGRNLTNIVFPCHNELEGQFFGYATICLEAVLVKDRMVEIE